MKSVLCDPKRGHFERGEIGKLLSHAGRGEAVQALLQQFFAQAEKDELYSTALTMETLNDRRAVKPLIQALLEDENPHRRHAAARALGWIYKPGRAAAQALGRCLADPNQPNAVREEAAESLAYVGNRETLAPLIDALRDPDVRIRFWAVFGLGSSCRGDATAILALESMLDDHEIPEGNWWTVSREALAMLGRWPKYKTRLSQEIAFVRSNPEASEADRRWVECYG